MKWRTPTGALVAVNHKVFSAEISTRIADPKMLSKIPSHFRRRLHNTIPLADNNKDRLHLLVGDPFVRFCAACREERRTPWATLIQLSRGLPASQHFTLQAAHLEHDGDVLLYRAPEHLAEFFANTGLGAPPDVYAAKGCEIAPRYLTLLKELYASDFALYESIQRPAQIASKATLLNEIKSAATAAFRFARSGFQTAPPDILAEREATCRACPEWDAKALNSTGRCRKCGCSTWAKLRMATERCPLGKWEPVSQPLQK